MSTQRKHHSCWWENVSHCSETGGETDGFSFVPVLRVILQKKAQTQQAREFHTKSIKEKAVHLSGMFSGDSSAVLKVNISSLICDPPWSCVLHYLPPTVFFCICMWKHAMFGICCMQPIFTLVHYFVRYRFLWPLYYHLYLTTGHSVNNSIFYRIYFYNDVIRCFVVGNIQVLSKLRLRHFATLYI